MPGFGQKYDTVEDAAAAALMWLSRQPRAVQQEYMGLLFEDPETGKFQRTGFATSGSRGSVKKEDANFLIPRGSLRGVVHNHPVASDRAEFANTLFSPTDISEAKNLGDVPTFLASMIAENRAQDSRLDPTTVRGASRKEPQAGEPFLAQFPIDEFKQALAREILGRGPNDPRGLRREALGSPPTLRQTEMRDSAPIQEGQRDVLRELERRRLMASR